MTSGLRSATAAALLAIAACTGTPATSRPAESRPAPTAAPTRTPVVELPTPVPPGPTVETFDNGNGRPLTITLVISNTNNSDGTYSVSGPARLCGNAVMNLTGNRKSFSVEFPTDSVVREIVDLTFGADDLLPGTTTPFFSIVVDVKAKKGGRPPGTVIHPNVPGSGDTGTATRIESGGTTTVTADGVNDFGESIHLEAVCGPRP